MLEEPVIFLNKATLISKMKYWLFVDFIKIASLWWFYIRMMLQYPSDTSTSAPVCKLLFSLCWSYTALDHPSRSAFWAETSTLFQAHLENCKIKKTLEELIQDPTPVSSLLLQKTPTDDTHELHTCVGYIITFSRFFIFLYEFFRSRDWIDHILFISYIFMCNLRA